MKYPAMSVTAMGDQGGSAYYRIVLPLLMADAKNYLQLRMPSQMLFFPIDQLMALKPDSILFHRSHTQAQKNYVNDLSHKLDLLKVFTIDDWVEKVPKESPHYHTVSPTIGKELRKIISMSDRLIVTNDVLAGVYGYRKETHIIPNYLSEAVWAQCYSGESKKTAPRPVSESARPRIGWSGGMGHPGDLQLLREVADILGDRVTWVFLGAIPPGFDQGNSEVHNPVVPPQYAQALYSLKLDLALAPLLDNDFNKGKSNLRILEYGACKYPVIASNVKTYRDTKPPVTLLEYNAKWWAQEILQKLENPEALKEEGQKLFEWVWENHKLEDHLDKYGDVLSPDGQSFISSVPEKMSDIVDVLITTHNSKELVSKCVESVIESKSHNKTEFEIIIGDDASTEGGMQSYLDSLAGHAHVIKQKANVGYINNVNTLCELHPARDVITLNSDTLVHGNWIDRLKNIAYSALEIASVSPWASNGSILSYPPKMRDHHPDKETVKFYDQIASNIDGVPADLPSSVGHCVFIKRSLLSRLGLFDDHAYGRAYGEENDWSLRAMSRGYRNVVGYDTYIGHHGTGSMANEKSNLMQRAALTLTARHPNYAKMLGQWMQADPLGSLRQKLDVAAIEKSTTSPRTLYIAHGYGGGLETYLQSQLQQPSNSNALVLRNDPANLDQIRLEVPGQDNHYSNLPIVSERLTNLTFFADVLRRFKVNRISVQTTFGYSYSFPIWIQNLAHLLGVDYDVMLHDYLTVCPRLRMVQTVDYCGAPSDVECNKCVRAYGSVLGQVNVTAWREMYQSFLNNASAVFAPSNDVAERIISKYFDDVHVQVVPHDADIKIGQFAGSQKWNGTDEIRVAVLGLLTPDKGSLVVRDCAQYCLENDIPIKFVVFGELVDLHGVRAQKIQGNEKLTILGRYEEQDIQTLLKLNACHLSFLPALCPESYSYTLSHIFRAGLFPICFDIGAPQERIRAMNFGKVLPYKHYKSPEFITNAIRTSVCEMSKLQEMTGTDHQA